MYRNFISLRELYIQNWKHQYVQPRTPMVLRDFKVDSKVDKTKEIS